ncbi:anthranilate synthase component I family protein [Sphingobacterium bambusae]|uniref:Anthranilate synthase component I family protein n=1 Tax=Sphingobacterium bambusae TaxID=662858 RepID=A0ABW6BKD1_9SPHI|nr:anthranilate synthase component I family protein [Sphingobacterium bambusae]WPL48962.1 anthranilate synthase component I family protein [Sphingobacterium bambusae]
MAKAIFDVNIAQFKDKALRWGQQFSECCFLESNAFEDEYQQIEALLAVDALDYCHSNTGKDSFSKLEIFRTKYSQSWMLGFFSYDLKNELEQFSPHHVDELGFPALYFFIPATIIRFTGGTVEIESENPEHIFQAIENSLSPSPINLPKDGDINIQKRVSKAAYLDTFDKMQQHIKRGDIYEVNLCQEFYAESVDVDPCSIYQHLNRVSPMPFSSFFKLQDHYILCASPERFLAKRGEQLISQPIKGTAPRGGNSQEDEEMINRLLQNPKERAENVMIVDLVRNDLTRSAAPASVDASRVLEVHTFPQVHQLISTVTCIKDPDTSDISAIRNTFPAGSMTGAPKIKAMQLCDSYEGSKRGIYAGSVGYFSPSGNFDFNVVIRSILYNQKSRRLSFHTGGAITQEAEAEHEYAECLLKASAILRTLSATLS